MSGKKIFFFLVLFTWIFSGGLLQAAESAPASASAFSKGDKIEVLWHGAWYKALVEQVAKDNLYKVSFYGYWHDRDEYVPTDRMRRIPERKYPSPSDLKEGDHLEFLDDDHWRPVVFVEMVGSKAKLRYADGEKQREELVPIYKLWKAP